jgi:hypothetical protein
MPRAPSLEAERLLATGLFRLTLFQREQIADVEQVAVAAGTGLQSDQIVAGDDANLHPVEIDRQRPCAQIRVQPPIGLGAETQPCRRPRTGR